MWVIYASPLLPRLLHPGTIRESISRGVAEGHLAYVGKSPEGSYSPLIYKKSLEPADIEISEDMFIIKAEEAEKYVKPAELTKIVVTPSQSQIKPGIKQTFVAKGMDQHSRDFETGNVEWTATGGTIEDNGVFTAGDDIGNFVVTATAGAISGNASVSIFTEPGLIPPDAPKPEGKPNKLTWSGEVTPQKWMNFYSKVLNYLLFIPNLRPSKVIHKNTSIAVRYRN